MEEENEGTAIMVGVGVTPPSAVTFPAPEGLDIGDMEEGDEKEVLAKVVYDGSGGFELVSVDGYPLAAEEEMEEEMPEEMPEEEELEGEGEGSFADTLANRARERGMM